jgi:hypothetical protein
MPYHYDSLEDLLASLEEKVIAPAAAKAQEIEERRRHLKRVWHCEGKRAAA